MVVWFPLKCCPRQRFSVEARNDATNFSLFTLTVDEHTAQGDKYPISSLFEMVFQGPKSYTNLDPSVSSSSAESFSLTRGILVVCLGNSEQFGRRLAAPIV